MRNFFTFILLLSWLVSMGQDSLFTATDKPASTTDNSPLTLGLVFRAKVDGFITDFKFYKPSSNDEGNLVIGIYTGDGVLLLSQQYQATGPAGWRRIKLEQPVRIDANANYVAAVFLPTGRYGYRENMFTADRTRGNLTAPANGRVAGNNRWDFGNALIFPKSYRNRAYYLDIVFYPRAPLIVNAGPDTAYNMPRDSFKLSGKITGDGTWFSWDMVDSLSFPWFEGTTVTMTGSGTLTPTVSGLREGEYTFLLTGWDMYGATNSSTVRITINADPNEVIFEILRNGTWRVKDDKKYFLMKTDAGR